VDEQLPMILSQYSENIGEALEKLLALEKKTRQSEDAISTGRILVAIIDLLYEKKEFKELMNYILILTKRRGQLKEAVKKMVKKSMTFLDSLDKENKVELIKTLITVTEGKIYVEKQRARLTLKLAHIYESEDNFNGAAKTIQEVHVETFGAMKKKEKTEFILEQMRLCLKKKDFIRTQIISRKINTKIFSETELEELKIKYYTLLIEFYFNTNEFLDIAKSYQQIYNTPLISVDPIQWNKYLKLMVLFISLSPYDNEQSDLMNRFSIDLNLEKLPSFKELIDAFLRQEVISWSQLKEQYHGEFSQLEDFQHEERGKLLWEELRTRVVEHNIRIVAKYYKSITLERFSKLLALDVPDTEKQLCKLVTQKVIYAKINRPQGIVSFRKTKTPEQKLNDWSGDIKSLLNVVEKATHYIQRENMIHHLEV